MLFIQRIHIQNFRSIVDETIDLSGIDCFVGKKDSGKSNVLKALNLFFNGQTDFNHQFNFQTDFSKYAKVRPKQASEIRITLDVSMPRSYVSAGVKQWQRIWRKDGLYSDNLKDLSNGKQKVATFLSKIQYLYIPAVKSNEYFQHLLEEMYDSMTVQVNSNLKRINTQYSKELQNLTTALTADLKSVLDIKSVIQMPENLNILFRDLSLSTSDTGIKNINLNQRGDGIKARHIPSILHYIQANLLANKGHGVIANSFIWGYEEPENGVELAACYNMAKELFAYQDTTQLLATTHSPAFYSQVGESGGKTIYVSKTSAGSSQYEQDTAMNTIDKDMGLLSFIAPYVGEKVKEYEDAEKATGLKLKEMEKKLQEAEGGILLITEGKTDTKHIQTAFAHLLPEDDQLLSQITYYDFGNSKTLGDELKNLLSQLANIQRKSIVIGLFDRDKNIQMDKGLSYKKLGNHVFMTQIPALQNAERDEADKICIENYFSNSEIKTDIGKGRLYLGNDFDEFGMSIDRKLAFQNFKENKRIKPYSIIDAGNSHLQYMCNEKIIIKKDNFADYVSAHPDEFSFENFRKIYDLINKIVQENS